MAAEVERVYQSGVSLDPSGENQDAVLDLILRIRPQWKRQDIQLESMTGGLVNSMWLCRTPSDPSDKLVVRIYRPVDRMAFSDREHEYLLMKTLSDKKLIQPLYAKFANGLIFKFVEGDYIKDYKIMHDPAFRDKFLKRLHPIINLPLADFGGPPLTWQNNCWYHFHTGMGPKCIYSFPNTELQQKFDAVLDKEKHQALVEVGKAAFEELVSRYPLKFCHHDLWFGNIIYCKETGELNFIDWEMGGAGIEPLEISNITQDWEETYKTDAATVEKFRRDWIRAYLRTRPGQSGDVSDELVDQWYRDVLKGDLITRIGCTCWCLCNAKEADQKQLEFCIDGCITNYKISCEIKAKIYGEK